MCLIQDLHVTASDRVYCEAEIGEAMTLKYCKEIFQETAYIPPPAYTLLYIPPQSCKLIFVMTNLMCVKWFSCVEVVHNLSGAFTNVQPLKHLNSNNLLQGTV